MTPPFPNLPPILMVALARRYGGIDTRVRQMAEALHGHVPYKVAVTAGSRLHQELEDARLCVLPLPYGRGDPRNLTALRRVIRQEGFAVVDAHNPQSHLWGLLAARLAGAPALVCTVHSVCRISERGLHRITLYETILRLCSRLSGRVVTVSDEISDYVAGLGTPRARIFKSINALEADRLAPGDGGMRADLGWGPDAFVVLTTVRLEPVKGVRHLLRAVERIRDRAPTLRCLIAGTGREADALRREAEALGLGDIVHFAGFRTDIPDLLREADLFCLPSLHEGFPFSAIESAIVGTPILATATGAMTEHFAHGATARLIPPGDEGALARELLWAAANPRDLQPMAEAARSLALARFAPARMVDETLAVYAGLLRERAGGAPLPGAAA